MDETFSTLAANGAILTCVLPVLVLGGLGFYLFRRGQKRQAAQVVAGVWPSTNGVVAGVWPSTTGVVISSAVQSRRVGEKVSASPAVAYHYMVKDHMYMGSQIRAGDQSGSISVAGDAEATVARYPVGANVTVYYNPANPAEAVLER